MNNLAEQSKERGNKLFQERRYEQAIAEYIGAIELDGTNPVYYSNIAAAYVNVGNYDNAIDYCKMAISKCDAFHKAHARMGKIYCDKKMFHRSLTCYELALKHDPHNANYKKQIDTLKSECNSQQKVKELFDLQMKLRTEKEDIERRIEANKTLRQARTYDCFQRGKCKDELIKINETRYRDTRRCKPLTFRIKVNEFYAAVRPIRTIVLNHDFTFTHDASFDIFNLDGFFFVSSSTIDYDVLTMYPARGHIYKVRILGKLTTPKMAILMDYEEEIDQLHVDTNVGDSFIENSNFSTLIYLNLQLQKHVDISILI
ncbi:hypothetical protein AKO1_015133 [Acrasis kona]|uniref:Tetratricopeptide repeat protein n=1 Tax=Acrasis kona TaxID=1008807 RepID=A0AAW2Z3F1_9EUKA